MPRRLRLSIALLSLGACLALAIYGVSPGRLACRGIDLPSALAGEPDVVMLGDSHVCSQTWEGEFPDIAIATRGRGGRTTRELLAWTDEVRRLQPQLVVLIAGTNDVVRRRALSEAVADYRRLVARLRPASALVLVSIPPCSSSLCDSPEQRRWIMDYNEEVEGIARESGSGFVDLHAALNDGEGGFATALTRDGAHVNAAGLARWKSLLRPWLEPYRRR